MIALCSSYRNRDTEIRNRNPGCDGHINVRPVTGISTDQVFPFVDSGNSVDSGFHIVNEFVIFEIMKSTLIIESDNSDKVNLLIRVAQEMGLSVTNNNLAEDFSKLARPGPALSTTALEELAVEMEADDDLLDESESKLFLQELKKVWKPITP
jgi:hypothetical protein